MVKRGEIYLVNLGDERKGSVQSGIRPAIIVQNNQGNKYSQTTIVCPLTSQQKKNIPTHAVLTPENGVAKVSVALCEQPTVVDKSQLMKKMGEIDEKSIAEIEKRIMISFGLKGASV